MQAEYGDPSHYRTLCDNADIECVDMPNIYQNYESKGTTCSTQQLASLRINSLADVQHTHPCHDKS